MVLDVQWLGTLRPIIWDFMKMTMQFQSMGKDVMLQGLCARDTSMEDGSHLLRSSLVRKQG